MATSTTTTTRTRKTKKQQEPNDHIRAYAMTGLGLTAAMSAGFNSFAHALNSDYPVFGVGIGIVIPILILILAKVSGSAWQRGDHRFALVIASAGISLLLLSLSHCAHAVMILTGSSLVMSWPVAIAIDVGMVCCEIALVRYPPKPS